MATPDATPPSRSGRDVGRCEPLVYLQWGWGVGGMVKMKVLGKISNNSCFLDRFIPLGVTGDPRSAPSGHLLKGTSAKVFSSS